MYDFLSGSQDTIFTVCQNKALEKTDKKGVFSYLPDKLLVFLKKQSRFVITILAVSR